MNEYKMKLKWRTFHSTTSFFYEIYFNIVFLFLIYRSLISHFLFPKISSIFFFHLCESNNFEIKKKKKINANILYNEHRFANISSTEVYLPNDATAISGAETSDLRGKAKTTRRKEKEERVTNEFVSKYSRCIRDNIRFRSLCRATSTCSTPSRGSFLLCSIFSSARILRVYK